MYGHFQFPNNLVFFFINFDKILFVGHRSFKIQESQPYVKITVENIKNT